MLLWEIDQDTISKIKANNRDVINKVYFDFLPLLTKMVRNFCWKYKKYDFIEDCLQEIYLLLPAIDYTEPKTIKFALYRKFREITFEKKASAFSLDSINAFDDNSYFVNLFESRNLSYTFDDEINVDDEIKKVSNLLDSWKLSDSEKDYLFCKSLGIKFLDDNLNNLYLGVFNEYKSYTQQTSC